MIDRVVNETGTMCPFCHRKDWHLRGSMKCEGLELLRLRFELAAWRALARESSSGALSLDFNKYSAGEWGAELVDYSEIGKARKTAVVIGGPQNAAVALAVEAGLIPSIEQLIERSSLGDQVEIDEQELDVAMNELRRIEASSGKGAP